MNMKVLIVEDNAAVRRMIRLFIDDVADEIFECADGDEALAAYRAFHPDWVLLDIKMKRMNGIAAAAQIKGAFPDAQILVVTSFNDAGLRGLAAEVGVAGFVLKENLEELRDYVAQWSH